MCSTATSRHIHRWLARLCTVSVHPRTVQIRISSLYLESNKPSYCHPQCSGKRNGYHSYLLAAECSTATLVATEIRTVVLRSHE